MQCDHCGYAATPLAAEFIVDPCGKNGDETISPLEKVATPNCNTIADLALFLNLPKCQTLKAMMYICGERQFVFVVVRGDLDVSEDKVRRVLGGKSLRPATEAESVAVGAAPGYASPRGLNVAPSLEASDFAQGKPPTANQVIVIADDSILTGANYAAGANEAGYHFINANYPRDFAITTMADVALPVDGLKCGDCGEGLLRETAGLWLGYCRQVETATASPGATLAALDATGRPQPIPLVVCEIDLGRLLTAIIETHHDEAGIIWPESLAPFNIHLIKLGKAPETATAAEGLYAELLMKGEKVLYDDRDESAGVKFADADLIGLPTRITVSDKSLKAGGVEVKRRSSAEKEIVPLKSI
jgi:prolyl-tRNA synthetase